MGMPDSFQDDTEMPLRRELEPEERKRAIEEPGKSWARWAREDLARYWYGILCLFIDIALNLQFDEYYSVHGGYMNMILVISAALALLPLIYIEFVVYRKIFPNRF